MVTLRDIALDAGVSVPTVSRVINTPEVVKQETRERVLSSIKKLRYTTNPVAKALVTNRTGVIDVYIPMSIELSNPFAMYFIAGISEILSQERYSFLIRRDLKIEHACDGYIVTGLLKNEIYDLYDYAIQRNRPMVLFGQSELPDVSCIDVNNVSGARRITEYLISKGHTKIAMINVDEDKDYTIDRFTGFKNAIEENDLVLDEAIITKAINSEKGGYEAMCSLLSKASFTSVFCATDTIALGAIRAVLEAGKSVPEEMSIVGFDGLGHHLLTSPYITTVQQPIFKIGKMLAEQLIKQIIGDCESTKRLIEPTLIIGKSVCDK